MHKNTLWLFCVLLIVYLALVYCDVEAERQNVQSSSMQYSAGSPALKMSESTDLMEEARTRRHRFSLHRHMWLPALAIAYWVKVKLIIVAFFVGSAVFVGLRYVWPQKCATTQIIRENPIIYDQPPPSFSHHDHIPYSLDHSDHYDHSFEASSSFEPYSAYDPSGFSAASPSTAPATAPSEHRFKRSANQRQVKTEEQIAEFIFSFLGLDSKACRRRFICEMEFRSKENPLTSMGFRIVGQGFFGKYTNARNKKAQANDFAECAIVNPECVFIEQNIGNMDEEEAAENVDRTQSENSNEGSEQKNPDDIEQNEVAQNTADYSAIPADEGNQEEQNSVNLKAERRGVYVRNRGNRNLNIIASHILTQMNAN